MSDRVPPPARAALTCALKASWRAWRSSVSSARLRSVMSRALNTRPPTLGSSRRLAPMDSKTRQEPSAWRARNSNGHPVPGVWRPRALGELFVHPRSIVRVDQLERAPSEHALGLIAEYALGGGTGIKPRAIRGEDGDHVRGVHDQRPEAFLALLEALLRPLALPAHLRLFESPLYSGTQAREVVLHDVVVRPRPHRLNRRLLPYLSRDDDEWRLRLCLARHLQRPDPRKAWHPPVRENHVPRSSLCERPPHLLRGVHPLVEGLVAPAP